jgi:coenzyme F420-dependent glucose-6-phosphate dehydrogenase
MAFYGYHASHEHFKPGVLLKYVQAAMLAGFSHGSCSDHFHPWSQQQGESGFAWSWLGAGHLVSEVSAAIALCENLHQILNF